MTATRGRGLRKRASEIINNAKSRGELIEKIARLLSEIDDGDKLNDKLTAELDKINWGKTWKEIDNA